MCVFRCNSEIEGVILPEIVQRALDQSSGDVGSSLAEPREQSCVLVDFVLFLWCMIQLFKIQCWSISNSGIRAYGSKRASTNLGESVQE